MDIRFVKYPAILGTAMILVAATPQGQDPDTRTSQGFVLKAGEHSLLEVIHNAAKFLGRNYLTDDGEFANVPTITLDKTLNLDAFGCEEVVSQLAYSRNFAMTAVDARRGIYEFIYIRGPRRPEIFNRATFLQPEEILRRTRLKMAVTTVVRLEHCNASRLTATVRPFFAAAGMGPGSVQIGNVGNEKSMLLSGFADQVATALTMFQEVDKASATESTPDIRDRLEKIEGRLSALESRAAPKK
jgi:hypothetical protein